MPEGWATQHRIVLPSGLRVERLPPGFAAGHWWMLFVVSGDGQWILDFDPGLGPPLAATDFRLEFEGPHGPFNAMTGSSGGDDYRHPAGNVVSITCEFGAIPWVVVRYVWRGSPLEVERLDLPEPPGPLWPVVGGHAEVESHPGADSDDDDVEALGPGESFVSLEEAARRNGVDESLIVSLVERGELTALTTTDGRVAGFLDEDPLTLQQFNRHGLRLTD